MTVGIRIRLKPAIAKSQGTGDRLLRDLLSKGFTGVISISAGKYIELEVPDGTEESEIEAMCSKLLAQKGTEEYAITIL